MNRVERKFYNKQNKDEKKYYRDAFKQYIKSIKSSTLDAEAKKQKIEEAIHQYSSYLRSANAEKYWKESRRDLTDIGHNLVEGFFESIIDIPGSIENVARKLFDPVWANIYGPRRAEAMAKELAYNQVMEEEKAKLKEIGRYNGLSVGAARVIGSLAPDIILAALTGLASAPASAAKYTGTAARVASAADKAFDVARAADKTMKAAKALQKGSTLQKTAMRGLMAKNIVGSIPRDQGGITTSDVAIGVGTGIAQATAMFSAKAAANKTIWKHFAIDNLYNFMGDTAQNILDPRIKTPEQWMDNYARGALANALFWGRARIEGNAKAKYFKDATNNFETIQKKVYENKSQEFRKNRADGFTYKNAEGKDVVVRTSQDALDFMYQSSMIDMMADPDVDPRLKHEAIKHARKQFGKGTGHQKMLLTKLDHIYNSWNSSNLPADERAYKRTLETLRDYLTDEKYYKWSAENREAVDKYIKNLMKEDEGVKEHLSKQEKLAAEEDRRKTIAGKLETVSDILAKKKEDVVNTIKPKEKLKEEPRVEEEPKSKKPEPEKPAEKFPEKTAPEEKPTKKEVKVEEEQLELVSENPEAKIEERESNKIDKAEESTEFERLAEERRESPEKAQKEETYRREEMSHNEVLAYDEMLSKKKKVEDLRDKLKKPTEKQRVLIETLDKEAKVAREKFLKERKRRLAYKPKEIVEDVGESLHDPTGEAGILSGFPKRFVGESGKRKPIYGEAHIKAVEEKIVDEMIAKPLTNLPNYYDMRKHDSDSEPARYQEFLRGMSLNTVLKRTDPKYVPGEYANKVGEAITKRLKEEDIGSRTKRMIDNLLLQESSDVTSGKIPIDKGFSKKESNEFRTEFVRIIKKALGDEYGNLRKFFESTFKNLEKTVEWKTRDGEKAKHTSGVILNKLFADAILDHIDYLEKVADIVTDEYRKINPDLTKAELLKRKRSTFLGLLQAEFNARYFGKTEDSVKLEANTGLFTRVISPTQQAMLIARIREGHAHIVPRLFHNMMTSRKAKAILDEADSIFRAKGIGRYRPGDTKAGVSQVLYEKKGGIIRSENELGRTIVSNDTDLFIDGIYKIGIINVDDSGKISLKLQPPETLFRYKDEKTNKYEPTMVVKAVMSRLKETSDPEYARSSSKKDHAELIARKALQTNKNDLGRALFQFFMDRGNEVAPRHIPLIMFPSFKELSPRMQIDEISQNLNAIARGISKIVSASMSHHPRQPIDPNYKKYLEEGNLSSIYLQPIYKDKKKIGYKFSNEERRRFMTLASSGIDIDISVKEGTRPRIAGDEGTFDVDERLKVKVGDLLDIKKGVIIHQVNNKGKMGAGIAKEIRQKYPQHYKDYSNSSMKLGDIVLTRVRADLGVVGMFSQDGYGRGKQFTDYNALESALKKIRDLHKQNPKVKFYVPYKIASGLGGGDWKKVQSLIIKHAPFIEVVARPQDASQIANVKAPENDTETGFFDFLGTLRAYSPIDYEYKTPASIERFDSDERELVVTSTAQGRSKEGQTKVNITEQKRVPKSKMIYDNNKLGDISEDVSVGEAKAPLLVSSKNYDGIRSELDELTKSENMKNKRIVFMNTRGDRTAPADSLAIKLPKSGGEKHDWIILKTGEWEQLQGHQKYDRSTAIAEMINELTNRQKITLDLDQFRDLAVTLFGSSRTSDFLFKDEELSETVIKAPVTAEERAEELEDKFDIKDLTAEDSSKDAEELEQAKISDNVFKALQENGAENVDFTEAKGMMMYALADMKAKDAINNKGLERIRSRLSALRAHFDEKGNVKDGESFLKAIISLEDAIIDNEELSLGRKFDLIEKIIKYREDNAVITKTHNFNELKVYRFQEIIKNLFENDVRAFIDGKEVDIYRDVNETFKRLREQVETLSKMKNNEFLKDTVPDIDKLARYFMETKEALALKGPSRSEKQIKKDLAKIDLGRETNIGRVASSFKTLVEAEKLFNFLLNHSEEVLKTSENGELINSGIRKMLETEMRKVHETLNEKSEC